MAVTANQIVKRQGRDGKLANVLVAASKKIPEGTLVFKDASGYATDVKVDANTVFVGVAREEVDNSSGSNGDKHVDCWADGDFTLPITLTDVADEGKAVHAADNYDATLTTTANPRIGTLKKFISTSLGVISIHGVGEATT